ncbi:hypothetical protein CVT26_006775 [Gymnopilus dilepis]|uniref:Uncharacterized protein n=1 Tax=Gymnopilus dilepis TaxID=231916 RepID=A0A409Y333_9AGAR|nr:hypothetical protein CVT26_006775 [Gymnopilus dilepis]
MARICKDLLVATTNHAVYVWDLESGRCSGALGEQSATVGFFHISISLPEPVVEVEQSDRMEAPLLVAEASFDVETWMLRTYILADTLEAAKAEDAPIEDSSCILPLVKGTDVIHEIHCLESFRRTSVTAGPDGSVRIWDILTGECKVVLIGHAASVDDVQIDQHRVYSSSTDLTARIWDRHSGDCLHILKPAVPSQLTV